MVCGGPRDRIRDRVRRGVLAGRGLARRDRVRAGQPSHAARWPRGGIGSAAVAAWVAFALSPSAALAISATGLLACLLLPVGALALAPRSRARPCDRRGDRAGQGGAGARSRETWSRRARPTSSARSLELAPTRSRPTRKRSGASRRPGGRRSARASRGFAHGLAEAFTKVQGQVEQRLASWHQDLDRAQGQLGTRLEQIAATRALADRGARGSLRRPTSIG